MNTAEQQVLVIITGTPGLEEVVVDWLLGRPENLRFTTLAASGHGLLHDALSPAERVSGRQRQLQFQVGLPRASLEEFLADASREFAGTDLSYQVLPLLAAGRLADFPG